MNLYTKGQNLHHAYCITGDAGAVRKELETFLKKELKFVPQANPDFLSVTAETLDIDMARAIKDFSDKKPIGREKIIFITANLITEKAQNAMLKMFEEPRGDTHFFLILPRTDFLLPTLRSRLFIIEGEEESGTRDAEKFIAMPVGERMRFVADLMEKISDETESKSAVRHFLDMLEAAVVKKFPVKDNSALFLRLEKARSYAGDQSPSLKMVLEYVALTLPAK